MRRRPTCPLLLPRLLGRDSFSFEDTPAQIQIKTTTPQRLKARIFNLTYPLHHSIESSTIDDLISKRCIYTFINSILNLDLPPQPPTASQAQGAA